MFGGGGGGPDPPCKNHKLLYVSFEILVRTLLEKQLDPSNGYFYGYFVLRLMSKVVCLMSLVLGIVSYVLLGPRQRMLAELYCFRLVRLSACCCGHSYLVIYSDFFQILYMDCYHQTLVQV